MVAGALDGTGMVPATDTVSWPPAYERVADVTVPPPGRARNGNPAVDELRVAANVGVPAGVHAAWNVTASPGGSVKPTCWRTVTTPGDG